MGELVKEWKRSSGRRMGGLDWLSYEAAGPSASELSSGSFTCWPKENIDLEGAAFDWVGGRGSFEFTELEGLAFRNGWEEAALENGLAMDGRVALAADSLKHLRQVLEATRRTEDSIVKSPSVSSDI